MIWYYFRAGIARATGALVARAVRLRWALFSAYSVRWSRMGLPSSHFDLLASALGVSWAVPRWSMRFRANSRNSLRRDEGVPIAKTTLLFLGLLLMGCTRRTRLSMFRLLSLGMKCD